MCFWSLRMLGSNSFHETGRSNEGTECAVGTSGVLLEEELGRDVLSEVDVWAAMPEGIMKEDNTINAALSLKMIPLLRSEAKMSTDTIIDADFR
jgi:hypothetical protein